MTPNMIKCSPVLIVALVVAGNVHAGVSAEEARGALDAALDRWVAASQRLAPPPA